MTIALWIQTILVLFIFFGNLFLALLVLLKGSDRGTNIRFALVVVATSFWVLLSNGTNLPLGLEIQTIILKVDLMVGVISAFLFLIFCSNLPRNNQLISKTMLTVLALMVSVFAILSFTKLVIADTWLIGNVIAYQQGILDAAYALFVAILLLLSLIVLVSNIKKEPASRLKLQANYILIASIFPVVTIIITNLLIGRLMMFTNDSSLLAAYILPSIGRLSLFIFTCTASYVILRYRLFGIRVVLGKSLFWLILLITIGSPIVITLTDNRLLVSGIYSVGYLLYMILVCILFAMYESKLRNIIKRVLVQYEYDVKEVLNSYTTELLNTNNIDEAVELFKSTIKQTIKTRNIVIVIGSLDNADKVIVKWDGYTDIQIDSIERTELLSNLFTTATYNIPFIVSDRKSKRVDVKVSEMLVDLAVEVVIPFKLGVIEGLVLLGAKNNGEQLSEEDLVIIDALILRMMIVVKNLSTIK